MLQVCFVRLWKCTTFFGGAAVGIGDQGLVSVRESVRREAAVALGAHGVVTASTVTAVVSVTATTSHPLVIVTVLKGTAVVTVSETETGKESTAAQGIERPGEMPQDCYSKYANFYPSLVPS